MAGTNEAERLRWNDERWYSVWPKRERLTSEVTSHLIAALAPRPGERVLDVGSGGGLATLAVAEAVGETGAAVGADISAALCRLAEERAAAAGARNATFAVADMQTDSIAGRPFDAALSQFGVMFFDEPVTAFANIRAHLRPGGRLAFACWQSLERNPWFPVSALGGFLSPPPQPEDGKSPTGPWALADADYAVGILEAAGFADVDCVPDELAVEVPEDSVVDEDQLVFMGVPAERLPAAMDAVQTHFRRFRVDAERSRFPLAFQIFTASNP